MEKWNNPKPLHPPVQGIVQRALTHAQACFFHEKCALRAETAALAFGLAFILVGGQIIQFGAGH